MTNRDAGKYSEAQYKRRVVQMRTLGVSPSLNQVMKVFSYYVSRERQCTNPL